ncbi:hydrolase [uncultured Agrococcus sp.]|uniref:hydrolase n=1 Tax=uncultured Agrococcus sp. TaxID=382258 RepID=UPI0025F3F6C4|nr:hydrolase [uncultured Agrococcus sp.]
MALTAFEPELISCATCAVEFGFDRSVLPARCAICDDERQYVPATGQAWVTQAELAQISEVHAEQLGSEQWGVTAVNVGIGQTMQVVRTDRGLLLWDPIGLVDGGTVDFIRSLGPTLAIVASHPHMYGAQVTWSRALGGAPVLIHAADTGWVQRRDPVQREWDGRLRLADGLELLTLGGHFPGSAIVHWANAAEGAGIVLAGDTVMVNPDRRTVAFLRSYPNKIPLSGAVTQRIADGFASLKFTQIWSNFGNAITGRADELVQDAAKRHIAWVRGDFDDLT